MSQKAVDQKNRWRSKTVAFRVSPEEWEEIERLVKLSGMSKQEYIMHRLQNREMTIQANLRVVKAIMRECQSIKKSISNVKHDDKFVKLADDFNEIYVNHNYIYFTNEG